MYAGIDIGGTKCAVTLGRECPDGEMQLLAKVQFATHGTPADILEHLAEELKRLLHEQKQNKGNLKAVGISCGGPLDSARGIVQFPPNLPGWDGIHVTDYFSNITGAPAYLENDANACAVAEWKYGAGRGKQNMIFLTFGTGLGAGLILNGALYRGVNGNAGEVGHLRLRRNGLLGFGKRGSAEGFCSGAGLARQARLAARRDPEGAAPLLRLCGGVSGIQARAIAELAGQGDRFCQEIYHRCGELLGETLAILVDLLNPERILLGGIYMRSAELLCEEMQRTLNREALPDALSACEVLPAGLGECIGDYAALSVAVNRERGTLSD